MIDLIGLYLEDSEKLLSELKSSWKVIETKPPKPDCDTEDGYPRVIRQSMVEGTYLLTVCRIPDIYRQ